MGLANEIHDLLAGAVGAQSMQVELGLNGPFAPAQPGQGVRPHAGAPERQLFVHFQQLFDADFVRQRLGQGFLLVPFALPGTGCAVTGFGLAPARGGQGRNIGHFPQKDVGLGPDAGSFAPARFGRGAFGRSLCLQCTGHPAEIGQPQTSGE